MDPVVGQAKRILTILSEHFKEHPPENQWNKEARPLVSEPNPLDPKIVATIAKRAGEILRSEPNVLCLSAPLVVSGEGGGSEREGRRGGEWGWCLVCCISCSVLDIVGIAP